MKPSLSTSTKGFLLLIVTTVFLIGLTLFATSELKSVTESRIEEINEKAEALNQELDKASGTEKEEIEKDIAGYTEKVAILKNKTVFYSVAMVIILGFLLLSVLYTHYFKAPICAPVSAVCILLGIGTTYQYIFSFDIKFILFLILSIVMTVTVYLIWRRINDVGNFLYFLLAGAVFILLITNIVFGKEVNGARLWIKLAESVVIQPGEFVKILLILLGALSYKSTLRTVTYLFTAFSSCLVFMYLRDLGTTVIIFLMLLYVITKLISSKVAFTGFLAAVIAFVGLVASMPYVQQRFANVGKAMTSAGSAQQTKVLESIIFGGFGGLGLENSNFMLNLFSATSDTAIAGILAVFGLPMLLIVMFAYSAIVIIPNRNAPLFPSSRLITVQASILLTTQVLLNFLGSIDVIPFTGVVAPFISDGGSAFVAFGILFGLILAAINPSLKRIRGLGA